MARTLKVYQAQIGFYDLIVAAPSKAAALRAWGIHLNMFADGSARIATDKQAIKAALAQPETPLKRAVGTHDLFSLNPGLPHISDFPQGEKKTAAKRQPFTKPSPPDRLALDAAETDLQRIVDQRRIEQDSYAKQYAELTVREDELRRRREVVTAEEAATKQHLDAASLRAEKALQRERQAYARAGGDPGPNT